MDILLIEGDAGRRVMLAKRLGERGHCVTVASSIAEAREILRFVGRTTGVPRAVVAAEKLLRRGGAAFREELAADFPETSWIPLRSDLGADWLTFWLDKLADRRPKPARRGRRPLNIWLIEPDDMMREAMAGHLAACGDRVSTCRSLGEAKTLLSKATAGRRAPHALVAPVVVGGADAISFYMSLRRRFAKARWIVTPAGQLEPTSQSYASMKMTSAAVESLGRAR